jgi:uncharacterized protein YcbX
MHIHSLFTYPVKSFRGIEHQAIAVERRGLQHDRRWVVVDRDQDNKFLSQRSHGVMATINTRVDEQGTLYLTAPGKVEFKVPLASDLEIQVQMWKDTSPAYDLGDDAAAWLKEVFHTPDTDLRLCYQDDVHFRPSDQGESQPDDPVSFADGFAVLIANNASLSDLNSKLAEPVGMDRFRPNIVINGFDAYAEDFFEQIKIGDITFDVVKGCSRCKIITLDQHTGQPGNPDSNPLKVLAEERRGYKSKTYFGVYAIPRGTGTIKVDDTIEVLSTRPKALHLD